MGSITENSRVSYPLKLISYARIPAKADHRRKQIIFLASAALGAQAGFSATSLAPSVFPHMLRNVPKAMRTARNVNLKLNQFCLFEKLVVFPLPPLVAAASAKPAFVRWVWVCWCNFSA